MNKLIALAVVIALNFFALPAMAWNSFGIDKKPEGSVLQVPVRPEINNNFGFNDNIPDETPEATPEVTPGDFPEETPEETPEEIPGETNEDDTLDEDSASNTPQESELEETELDEDFIVPANSHGFSGSGCSLNAISAGQNGLANLLGILIPLLPLIGSLRRRK